MKIAVFTQENHIPGEHECINLLFREGLELLHLRKPNFTAEDCKQWLKNIAPQYLRRIVVHAHFELLKEFNLKGIHLSSWNLKEVNRQDIKEFTRTLQKKSLTLSSSVHNLSEVEKITLPFNYVFLSPVYQSISKEGYRSKISKEEMKACITHLHAKKIQGYALGGIHEENISALASENFSGAGLLGYLWQGNPSAKEVSERFKIINKAWNTAEHLH